MIDGTEKNQMSQSLMCSAAQALVQHDVLLQLLKFALEVLDEFMGPIAIALDRLQGKSECFLGLLMPTIQQASKKKLMPAKLHSSLKMTTLLYASPVHEGESWCRRDVVVGHDYQCILVKFWNEYIPQNITPGR